MQWKLCNWLFVHSCAQQCTLWSDPNFFWLACCTQCAHVKWEGKLLAEQAIMLNFLSKTRILLYRCRRLIRPTSCICDVINGDNFILFKSTFIWTNCLRLYTAWHWGWYEMQFFATRICWYFKEIGIEHKYLCEAENETFRVRHVGSKTYFNPNWKCWFQWLILSHCLLFVGGYEEGHWCHSLEYFA